MIVGDRNTVWANVFQSGGLWHFNIHHSGERFAVYASRFKDGHKLAQDAEKHAADLLPAFGYVPSA
jgi:hypothetical protein